MEEVKHAIEVVGTLEQKYDLSVDDVNQIKNHFDDKVYVPLIGRFSAGKSALINTLLGWDEEICKEDIGVATAIPTEVFYGDEDIACICRPEKEFISMGEYLQIQSELSTANAEVVKLQFCENETLQKFPSIALVDMPGLDSGYEVHDKAIESYIKNSMACVLVFPADELIIPASMEPILYDLNTYDMSMCAVITKGGRIVGYEEQNKAELRRNLSKYFGDKQIPVFITEKETGELGGLVEYLTELEGQADALGRKYYSNRLKPVFAKVTNYLNGYIKNLDLSMSELEEQQDKLQNEITNLNESVSRELDDFSMQIPKLVDGVAMDVQAALSQRQEELVFDLLHDTDITAEINQIVKNALNASYQTRVQNNIRKHLDKISEVMSLGSAGYASVMKIDIDQVCGTEISGIGRTAITVIGVLLGGPIVGIIAHVVTGLINENSKNKRKEAELKMRQQLSSNIFPQIDREIRDKVETDLNHVALEMRKTVEKNVGMQVDALKKSLDEVIAKKQTEDENKEQKRIEIENDIQLLQEAEYGIE
jgi:hypothetical protein